MRRLLFLVVCLVGAAAPAAAQERSNADPVAALLGRLEQMLVRGEREQFAGLFDPSAAEAGIRRYESDLFLPGAAKAVVRERERAPLEGTPPGDGFRLVVEFFVATPGRARILTAGMDVRRPPNGNLASWRIVALEGISSVDGLYRLRLDTGKPFAAKNFKVTSEDLTITLDEGTVFPVQTDEGVTGMVLVGRGEMQFLPAPPSERGQLRIFAGRDMLNAAFETAFIRLNPSDYRTQVAALQLPRRRSTRASSAAPRACSSAWRPSRSWSICATSAPTTGICCRRTRTSWPKWTRAATTRSPSRARRRRPRT
jgi:hypothetical protein